MSMIDIEKEFEKWVVEYFGDTDVCPIYLTHVVNGFKAAANLYRERLEEAEKVIEFYGDTKRYQRAHHFHAALVIDDEGDIENIDSYRGNLTWTVAGKTARQYLSKYQTSEGK